MKRRARFQQTLASQAGFEKHARKSKRELFLDQMEQVVPWAELLALVAPYYPKTDNGRQPVGLEIMLRTYFLQQWFNLSDPGMEEAFYESPVLRRFAGVDLGRAAAPDETTILRFRHLLEEHDLGGEMLVTVNQYLEARGIRITTGTIVDATIIHAPSSTKNSSGKRDPEMHQVKKGNQWYIKEARPCHVRDFFRQCGFIFAAVEGVIAVPERLPLVEVACLNWPDQDFVVQFLLLTLVRLTNLKYIGARGGCGFCAFHQLLRDSEKFGGLRTLGSGECDRQTAIAAFANRGDQLD
jgi:hypothetical protein